MVLPNHPRPLPCRLKLAPTAPLSADALQAAACADAGAALISPFVGRILDWYKKKEERDFTPEEVGGWRGWGEP